MFRHGRQRFQDLEEVPAFVIQRTGGDKISPFWNTQAYWAEGKQLARFGHRFLSVHRVATPETGYDSYGESVGDPLDKWLDVAREASDEAGYPIERIGFGYVNSFTFSVNEFDVSRFFKLGVFLDIGEPAPSLHGLEAKFKFAEDSFLHQIALSAEPQPDKTIRVVTKVFVEREVGELNIQDSKKIATDVAAAHETAKSAFFKFATEETHEIMKAQYADS